MTRPPPPSPTASPHPRSTTTQPQPQIRMRLSALPIEQEFMRKLIPDGDAQGILKNTRIHDMPGLRVSHSLLALKPVFDQGTPFNSTPSSSDSQFVVKTVLKGTLFPITA
ncbi:hypothetical protein L226DRAFT_573679 [Lentinus tigrinus ALCF2SS1-7]|uniref:Uncharacterized protein n=1 Tax=Lentinus tigrinus ALCF2SS1-6 TaxID=1328759 RepID=A0A5C2S0V6_9APHY|nr:hypothetical protein L227DRAFT_614096 [Lentinus tigrinus ALCF2SS1-6]RPD71731.1 hypothetical protein L226DRAFT_573679 [Lentinus tigrinus ALCF2SS1-7]